MAIADTITSMQNHTSNAYNVLAYATDLTGINKNLANLKQCIFDSLINSMTTCENPTWNNLPKLTTTPGTTQSINNTTEAPMKIELGANELSQDSTPTPTSPQAVHTITGENTIKVCGKNLFDKDSITQGYLVSRDNGSLGANASYGASDYIEVQVGENYTFSYFNRWYSAYYDENKTYVGYPTNTATITIPTGVKYIRTSVELVNLNFAQFEKGSASTYEPYKGNSYEINLGVENLYDLPSADTSNTVVYSINTDGTINLSGTASADATFMLYKDLANTGLVDGGTYTFSVNKSLPSGVEIRLEAYNGTTWQRHILGSVLSSSVSKKTDNANLTNTTRVRYLIYVANGTNVSISNLGIQLEKGSKQNSFSKYGTTPIEYCKIGDYKDEFIRTAGKNLWHFLSSDWYSNANTTYSIIDESTLQVVSNSATYANTKFKLDLPDGTYTFSLGKVVNSNSNMTIKRMTLAYYKNGTRTAVQNIDEGTPQTLTITNETDKQYVLEFWSTWSSAFVNTATFSNIMINKGQTSFDYEPYGKNEWWLKKAIGKVVLDGSEAWTLNTSASDYYEFVRYGLSPTGPTSYLNAITNYFSSQSSNRCIVNGQAVFIRVPSSVSITTAEQFKTWLGTHNTIMYYSLATPTYTKINIVDLINQLEAIRNSKSQNNQTNIFQENTDLAFILNTTALEDLS